jgi:hypothetical protein
METVMKLEWRRLIAMSKDILNEIPLQHQLWRTDYTKCPGKLCHSSIPWKVALLPYEMNWSTVSTVAVWISVIHRVTQEDKILIFFLRMYVFSSPLYGRAPSCSKSRVRQISGHMLREQNFRVLNRWATFLCIVLLGSVVRTPYILIVRCRRYL